MTKSRGINRPGHKWTQAEIELLTQRYPHEPAQRVAEALSVSIDVIRKKVQRLGLKKSQAFFESDMAGRILRGQQNPAMIATRFRPGQKPWNNGMKGLQMGGLETQFKPGQRPHTWVPVGSYRVNGDGYLDQKTTDAGPAYKHWEAVHRLVWKKANGSIPRGHVIVFKPSRRSIVLEQITADALECITRSELARRNNPSAKSPELGRLSQLRGAITRQINRRLRDATTVGMTS